MKQTVVFGKVTSFRVLPSHQTVGEQLKIISWDSPWIFHKLMDFSWGNLKILSQLLLNDFSFFLAFSGVLGQWDLILGHDLGSGRQGQQDLGQGLGLGLVEVQVEVHVLGQELVTHGPLLETGRQGQQNPGHGLGLGLIEVQVLGHELAPYGPVLEAGWFHLGSGHVPGLDPLGLDPG